MATPEHDFMDILGTALGSHLEAEGISESDAARRMGMERATLNTYTHGLSTGKRRRAPAELLARACIDLGFRLELEGYTISATKNSGEQESDERQFRLEFSRDFEVGQGGDRILIGGKKPAARVEFTISMKSLSA